MIIKCDAKFNFEMLYLLLGLAIYLIDSVQIWLLFRPSVNCFLLFEIDIKSAYSMQLVGAELQTENSQFE